MGRVVVAVLDHGDRPGDQRGLRHAQRAEEGQAGWSVHRLRREGAARLRPDRRAGRRCCSRSRTRRSASSPSPPSTPTGCWSRWATPSAPPRRGNDPGTPSRPPSPSPPRRRTSEQDPDERHTPRRLHRSRRRSGPEDQWRQGRRPGRQRRADLRLRLGVHRQPLQGQPDPVEPGGGQGRHRPRRRAQLRWRQLLHGRRGLPDHARGRRTGGRRARHRSARRGGVLDRPDRAEQPAREPRQGRRRLHRGTGRRRGPMPPRRS